MGKLDLALKDYDEAMEKDDADPYHFYNRGNAFLAKKLYSEAHKDYDKAISININNPKFWYSKGLAYYDTNDPTLFEDAAQMFTKSVQLSDHFAAGHYHLGIMFHKTNQFADALKCFTKVLNMFGKDKLV